MRFDSSAILAISILGLIAVGLVFAALYAIYGRPSTASGRERQRHVANGFRLAGGILLGFVLVGTFVISFGVAFFGNPGPVSSKPLALLLAAISLALIALLVQRWARILGGWIAYGALNGLLMASSGHLLNNPAIPVRRSWALMMTGVAIASALACLRFTEDYRLNWVEKIALVGWVVCLAVGVNEDKYGLPALTVGGVGLVLAWLNYRRLNRSASHRRAHHRSPKTV